MSAKIRQMLAESQVRKAWAEANPQLAAAWDEAWEMNATFDRVRNEQDALAVLRAEVPRRLRIAGVPGRCVDLWQTGLRDTYALTCIEAVVSGRKSLLLLSGGPGTGKTVAGVEALARRFLRPCRETEDAGLFVRATEASRLGLYGDETRRRVSAMLSTQVLVLDDLGAELLSDAWRALLDEIVDTRYGDRLTTVLTTNLESGVFREKYGARVTDRVRHDGLVAECGTQSMRRAELAGERA